MPAAETAPAFPVPFAAPENQSWRDIAASLRRNALGGFSPRAFEERVIARRFAGRDQIILSAPEAIRHVLIENSDNYRRTAATRRLLAPVLGRGMLLATGEDWRAQRRAAAPALAPRMMPDVARVAAQACDRLVAELAACGGAPVDLFGRLQVLALEVAAAALFSLDLAEQGPALRAELQEYADGAGRPTLLDFLLPAGLPTPRSFARWRFRRRWMARIARLLETRLRERGLPEQGLPEQGHTEPIAAPVVEPTGDLFRGNRMRPSSPLTPVDMPAQADIQGSGRGRKPRVPAVAGTASRKPGVLPGQRRSPCDLFDMMREAAVSDRVLVEQVATMLAAGHETTAVALFWSCYILARAPGAQHRIAAEAGPLDLTPSGAAQAVSRLPYTRAVIDETLRLYPPAFSIIRQARDRDEAAGVPIPPDAVILIVPWVLHRHKKLWRDPDLFMPERFLPGAAPPERFSYLPFGAGPRACIGAQFALTEAVVVLARLVREFEIERADPRPVLPLALITLQPDRRPLFRLRRR